MTDIVITAANVAVSGSGITETGVAGAALTAGQAIFRNSSGVMVLADADSTSLDEITGIALHAAASGQPITYAKPGTNITIGATLTAGSPYYLSTTPGGIAPFADLDSDDRVICLGHAISTSVLAFRPFDTGVILA